MTAKQPQRIAFQGALGAYSHEACLQARPDATPVPCTTFEGVLRAVREGRADLAMLPVENTTYGRVADIHRLLPESGMHIIDEAFVRVRIALMAQTGVTLRRTAQVLRKNWLPAPQAPTACWQVLSRRKFTDWTYWRTGSRIWTITPPVFC